MAEGFSVKVIVGFIMRWPGRRLAPVAWEAPCAYEVAWEALLAVAWEALLCSGLGGAAIGGLGGAVIISGLSGAVCSCS